MKSLPESWYVVNDGSLLFRNTVTAYMLTKRAIPDEYEMGGIGTFYGFSPTHSAWGSSFILEDSVELSLAEFIEVTNSKENLVLTMANELLYEQGTFTGRQLKIELYEKFGLTISYAHTREILHSLRCSGKLPLLVANTTGYWIATTTMEVEKYRDFLQERAKKFFELSACIRDQAELKFGNQLDLQIK